MPIPLSSTFWTIGAVSGIPGLLITSSALRMSSSEWPPCSYGIFHYSSIETYFLDRLPISERNTSKPLTFARTAEPTPLSPPPKTTTLDIYNCYLTFNNAIVTTARMIPMIQNLTTILASGMALTGLLIRRYSCRLCCGTRCPKPQHLFTPGICIL